jgi:ubiquinone/menaquinone biosynthesis C-methylase UbiE
MSPEALEYIIKVIREKLALLRSDRILEVGCGSGMILGPLSRMSSMVAGVDFASSLIQKIQKVIPNGEFHVSEANNLPFGDATFDKILSFSVFQYFPDFSYAKEVLNEMVRCTKNNGRIYIGDIPDFALAERYEEIKMRYTVHEDFKDEDLKHLFYSRTFFQEFFKDLNCKCEIFDGFVRGYVNSKFRFNVVAFT